jgi:diguanylate cyclase (GGDEF)-like protein
MNRQQQHGATPAAKRRTRQERQARIATPASVVPAAAAPAPRSAAPARRVRGPEQLLLDTQIWGAGGVALASVVGIGVAGFLHPAAGALALGAVIAYVTARGARQRVSLPLITGSDDRQRITTGSQLQRGVFDASFELLGDDDLDGGLQRIRRAVMAWWRCDAISLWIRSDGAWRRLDEVGGPAPDETRLRLPGAMPGPLVLPLGDGDEAPLLLAQWAEPVGILREAPLEDHRAVAEILRAQLALALRRLLLQEEAATLARNDPLTGTCRRWYGERRLGELILRDGGGALAFIDIDRFKRINDTWGHATGDRILTAVGAVLLRDLRPSDLVSRWGGEEFIVLLPGLDWEQACSVVRRLLSAIAAIRDEQADGITASAGVTGLRVGESPETVLARADAGCYRAKEGGRNRLVLVPPEGSPRTDRHHRS